MKYWLLKSEPADWSWQDQVSKGDAGEMWTGVRNYQARNMMRDMRCGDLAFFYHSQSEKACVGIVEIVTEAAPDPTDDSGKWDCVTVKAIEALPAPVTLAAVKNEPGLADMALVRSARLSVQPVTPEEWSLVRRMGGLD